MELLYWYSKQLVFTIIITTLLFYFYTRMKILVKNGNLSGIKLKAVQAFIYGLGLPSDIYLNFLYSIPLLELPHWTEKEFTLSSRFSRLKKENNFRGVQARFWCRVILNKLIPGHCGE